MLSLIQANQYQQPVDSSIEEEVEQDNQVKEGCQITFKFINFLFFLDIIVQDLPPEDNTPTEEVDISPTIHVEPSKSYNTSLGRFILNTETPKLLETNFKNARRIASPATIKRLSNNDEIVSEVIPDKIAMEPSIPSIAPQIVYQNEDVINKDFIIKTVNEGVVRGVKEALGLLAADDKLTTSSKRISGHIPINNNNNNNNNNKLE